MNNATVFSAAAWTEAPLPGRERGRKREAAGGSDGAGQAGQHSVHVRVQPASGPPAADKAKWSLRDVSHTGDARGAGSEANHGAEPPRPAQVGL